MNEHSSQSFYFSSCFVLYALTFSSYGRCYWEREMDRQNPLGSCTFQKKWIGCFIKSSELLLQQFIIGTSLFGKSTYHLLCIFECKGWVFSVLSWLKIDTCRRNSCLLDLPIFLFIICFFTNCGCYIYCKEMCICQLSRQNFAIFSSSQDFTQFSLKNTVCSPILIHVFSLLQS